MGYPILQEASSVGSSKLLVDRKNLPSFQRKMSAVSCVAVQARKKILREITFSEYLLQ